MAKEVSAKLEIWLYFPSFNDIDFLIAQKNDFVRNFKYKQQNYRQSSLLRFVPVINDYAVKKLLNLS